MTAALVQFMPVQLRLTGEVTVKPSRRRSHSGGLAMPEHTCAWRVPAHELASAAAACAVVQARRQPLGTLSRFHEIISNGQATRG
jgi:hypothetical protein